MTASPPQQCILGPTQDGCALAEVLKKCLLGEILGIVCDFRENRRTKSATGVAGLQKKTARPPVIDKCGRCFVWLWQTVRVKMGLFSSPFP